LFLIKQEFLFDPNILLLIEPIIDKLKLTNYKIIQIKKLLKYIKFTTLSNLTSLPNDINLKIAEY
jgi:hypothetical protein